MRNMIILFLPLVFVLAACSSRKKYGDDGNRNVMADPVPAPAESPLPNPESPNKCVTGNGCVNLSWDPTTKRMDGSDIVVSGYKVHYGTISQIYTDEVDAGNNTTFTVANLLPGTYYFAVSAYLNVGTTQEQSGNSNEVNSALNSPTGNKNNKMITQEISVIVR